MTDLPKLILGVLASLFKSRARLEAEILILRQQINVLRRRAPKRPHLNNTDRFLFVWLYHWFPSVLGAIAIVRPETIIRWHRTGFRAYWRWRSRNRVGRRKVSAELCTLIGEMSGANLLWGGRRLTEGDLAHGLFMQPAVLGNVTPEMRIAREEVFGPVVAVLAVENFEEALDVANSVDVGLSASIVTRDLKKAMLYTERIEAGVVKVNQISTGLALQAPFGGVKKSSTDSFKEQGAGAIDFYTRIKTVYLDYSA